MQPAVDAAWSVGRMFAGSSESGRTRDPSDDFWFQPIGPQGAAGFSVTPETVVQIPEVYDCLNVISETVAWLPLGIFERRPDGSKERADNHPVHDVLHHRANDRDTALEFRMQMQWDFTLHRNAFAEILPGPRGAVDQLIRLDPLQVSWVTLSDGLGIFEFREPDGRTRRIERENMLHLKRAPFQSGGVFGTPVIETGREVLSRAIAIQDFAARFFRNSATPGGVIEMDQPFASDEDRKRFEAQWRRAYTGFNRHKTAVLLPHMKWANVQATNEESQFIETAKEVALQIARLFRMPPHKIGILDKATFSNIEQQSLEFVTDTMMQWLVAWEQAIRRDLILDPERFIAEFNVAALLRGDLKTRFEAYSVGRNWGWLSVNEIRKLENMNPIPQGDTYLQPLNMVPAGSTGDQTDQAKAPEVLGPRGEVVSRIYGENIVRMEDYRNVA